MVKYLLDTDHAIDLFRGSGILERQIAFLEKHFTILPFRAHAEYGAIRATLEKQGKRLDDMDILIAATAIRESVTLLTENARHFSRIPDLRTECWR